MDVFRGPDVINGKVRTVSGPPVNARRLRPQIVVEPSGAEGAAKDIVQEWGEQSFPASDPPSNW
ncbi:hypothetical protein GCM10009559_01110 [Pseudonocardia zijingensis]|uniref:Uncharacterized protein n=1 Tax=Pseudonocardia zijingensis TaxID=153376 RepID=A0ABN1NXW1_9PSEU